MIGFRWVAAVVGLGLVSGCGSAPGEARPAARGDALPTIAAVADAWERHDGFVPFYWDAAAGRLWLVLRDGQELLYATGLASGLGSNPVGLDRGQVGGERIVDVRRTGGRLLMVARNLRYRALSDNAAERRAVADSFAASVLWGFEIAAEDDDGAVLVDATPFLLSDRRGIARTLQRRGQGGFSLDGSRSAVHRERCAAFPDNTELEALLTFTSGEPGGEVRATAADAGAVSLRTRHSFIRLPDDGYQPREADPRVGYNTTGFADYAAAIDAPMRVRWIQRHRLRKRDPSAARSHPVQGIVYYLDPGVPEPVRSALRDGAAWWAEAFEDAGFIDAFRVEDLPAGADPLDVRYNMIHWVHRATRGWSYGGSISDPRTGEILKGNVLLGSLRVRQDYLILRALGTDEEARRHALARLRQLAAHELGHTLGLTHNFAASTYGGRASVMDYPAPLVTVTPDGALDLSAAYGVGVGGYDRFAIRYGYTEFAPGIDAAAALRAMVDSEAPDHLFLSDADARPAGAAHPLASLWDNGADPVAALVDAVRVRAAGLRRFASREPDRGSVLAEQEEMLVPLYLHHRYQLAATVKMLGGQYYEYSVAAAAAPPPTARRAVPAPRQRAALAAVLQCIDAELLTPPPAVLEAIPPHPPGYGGERFDRATGAPLDPVAMAVTAARLVLDGLLQRQRAARLAEQVARDPAQLGFGEVLGGLVARTLGAPRREGLVGLVQRAIDRSVLERLMDLAVDPAAAPVVRAAAHESLVDHAAALGSLPPAFGPEQRALQRDLESFLRRPDLRPPPAAAPETPPGDPIGTLDFANSGGGCAHGRAALQMR